mmetsp:Transcript_9918/g.26979  ORF Transcript_9918/g.26979 Transcript_9918/m.26979 type:complete len:315 (-) Transcript_9918:1178-2122(-)
MALEGQQLPHEALQVEGPPLQIAHRAPHALRLAAGAVRGDGLLHAHHGHVVEGHIETADVFLLRRGRRLLAHGVPQQDLAGHLAVQTSLRLASISVLAVGLRQAPCRGTVELLPHCAEEQFQVALAIPQLFARPARGAHCWVRRLGCQRGGRQCEHVLRQELASRPGGAAPLAQRRGRCAQGDVVGHGGGEVGPRHVALEHPQHPIQLRQVGEAVAPPVQGPQGGKERLAARDHGPERGLQGGLHALGDVHRAQEVLPRQGSLEPLLAGLEPLHGVDRGQDVAVGGRGDPAHALIRPRSLLHQQARQGRGHGTL